MIFQRISVWPVVILLLFFVGVLANNETKPICAEKNPAYKVTALPGSSHHLNEGPHWDVATENLYTVDIESGKLKRYDYKENKMYICQIENEKFASFVIPMEGLSNKFAVGIQHRIALVAWDGVSETCKVEKTIVTVEESNKKYNNNRFNDAKCDPRGRLFAGTMRMSDSELRTGNLYKVLKYNEYELLESNIAISNGLAWNKKAKKFYHIDSKDYNVKQFDYDIQTGEIKNPKVIFNLCTDETNIVPDGMTIDSEGFLYVAINGGSAVFKIDPKTGEIVLKIKIPAKQVTSVAFGGPKLDILFVTTADETSPNATSKIYKVTGLGAKGLPMTKVKLEN